MGNGTWELASANAIGDIFYFTFSWGNFYSSISHKNAYVYEQSIEHKYFNWITTRIKFVFRVYWRLSTKMNIQLWKNINIWAMCHNICNGACEKSLNGLINYICIYKDIHEKVCCIVPKHCINVIVGYAQQYMCVWFKTWTLFSPPHIF